jgi:hypothetical protein
MAVGFSDAEVAVVQAKYSYLERIAPNKVGGSLELNASFEDYAIRDTFSIQIEAADDYPDHLPVLVEVGGRTAAIAAMHKISDLRDLHRNVNGSACLCVKQMEIQKFPPGSDLFVFVEDLVVPYLYGLSYFETHGHWPWPDFSHETLGLLEFYAADTAVVSAAQIKEIAGLVRVDPRWKEYHKQIRRPNSDRFCPCGSSKPFGQCHLLAYNGVRNLHEHVKRLGLRVFQ